MSSEINKFLIDRGLFSRLCTPHPTIQDISARRTAQVLSLCSLVICLLLVFGLVTTLFIPTATRAGQSTLIAWFILTIVSYIFSRTRFYIIGSMILSTSLAVMSFWLIAIGEDPLRSIISIIPLAMILGSVFLPFWGMAILSCAIVLTSLFLGRLAPGIDTSTIAVSVGTLMTMGIAFLAAISFRNSIERQRFDSLHDANHKLREIQTELEQRVNERTVLLEQRNFILQAIADFAHLANSAHDQKEFLDLSVKLIAERFNFEHVGIFLTDDLGEHAILYASNSPTGKSLISNKYQLTFSKGESTYILPEIDVLRFQLEGQNYKIARPVTLPDIRMNMSYAIAIGQRLIGLLNIQTISPNPEYIGRENMQVFSDQIALSLQNIRLSEQLRSQFAEIDQLGGRTIKSSWERILGGETLGYIYDRLQILPANETLSNEVFQQLLLGHSISYTSNDERPQAKLISPIILRGEVIGILGYEDEDPQHEWLLEEKILLETIASRVSLALENSRLITETQQRADRERIVGQVATRMRETLDIDTVLKTAVQEMRRSLDLEQAEVRLQLGIKPEGKKE